ncbi:MAG TPA: universal stress protein [Ornithinibacter sp.]|nr:universal stress protein [Ornithinibacter sp.]
MVNERRRRIVVGVDGSEQSDRAVRYAVAEARRRGAGITLVHAVHETAPMAAMLPLYSMESFTEVGQRLVDDAERLALELDPDVDVSTSVQSGGRVGVLVEAGEHACLVVLGHRARSLAGRVLASSTTTGVGARAHCPVVSVPDCWVPGGEYGRVVVGIDESSASHDAVSLAFGEASRRNAQLVVMHAWRLPTAYDDISYSRISADEWMGSAREEMEKTLAPFRDVYPDVDVDIDLRHEYAGPALAAATEGADLIVVGRRGHGAPMGIYLGSLARMLVREGRCPVEIAPQHSRHEPTAEERLMSGREAPPE